MYRLNFGSQFDIEYLQLSFVVTDRNNQMIADIQMAASSRDLKPEGRFFGSRLVIYMLSPAYNDIWLIHSKGVFPAVCNKYPMLIRVKNKVKVKDLEVSA